jgi:hypothetical protein
MIARGCSRLMLAGLASVLVCGESRAGDSVCWILNGVLLVPAVAAGVNGVFILDTGQARSQLDATQASGADIGAGAAVGDVRLAGRVFPEVSMSVESLDVRTRDFPVPIAGVLGADVLAGQVMEVRPDPCRVRLGPSRGGRRASMPVTLKGGVPYVQGAASDGTRGMAGAWRIATGSPSPVVLDLARDLAPAGRLRALTVSGRLVENLAAAASPTPGGDALGAIGEPVWSQFNMRLDLGRRTLSLTPPPSRGQAGVRAADRPVPESAPSAPAPRAEPEDRPG